MVSYETILFAILSVSLFIFGVWFGRRLERYEVYLKLLSSRDPQAWTVAHLLRKGKTLADPPDTSGDGYSPSALVPRVKGDSPKEKTTVKSVRETTSKPGDWTQ